MQTSRQMDGHDLPYDALVLGTLCKENASGQQPTGITPSDFFLWGLLHWPLTTKKTFTRGLKPFLWAITVCIHQFRALCIVVHGCQHLAWWGVVSQELMCVPTTFDHHWCINNGSIAEVSACNDRIFLYVENSFIWVSCFIIWFICVSVPHAFTRIYLNRNMYITRTPFGRGMRTIFYILHEVDMYALCQGRFCLQLSSPKQLHRYEKILCRKSICYSLYKRFIHDRCSFMNIILKKFSLRCILTEYQQIDSFILN
jgi:hypothetical protein